MDHTWKPTGELQYCSKCGSFEGATTTDCPGYQMSSISTCMSTLIYRGFVDFRGGKWLNQPAPGMDHLYGTDRLPIVELTTLDLQRLCTIFVGTEPISKYQKHHGHEMRAFNFEASTEKRIQRLLVDNDILRHQASALRQQLVWCFSEDGPCKFIQGEPGEHEINNVVTAEEVQSWYDGMTTAQAEAKRLRAELERVARFDVE